MDLRLTGKRALIAGGSSGIGFSCAEMLLREGAEVFLVSRSQEKLKRAAEQLGLSSRSWTPADLTTADGVGQAFGAAVGGMGGVDIVVNNGGGPRAGSFGMLTDEDWNDAFQLNLMNTVRLTRLALEGMKQRGWGRIVNITSTSVKQPIEGLMLSNSLRLAVVGMAKTLANEVGRFGITVNSVAPGFAHTERLEQLAKSRAEAEGVSSEEMLARWAAEVPLGRVGKAEEIAAVVVFLASEAAAYVNGVTLAVDGGRVKSSM